MAAAQQADIDTRNTIDTRNIIDTRNTMSTGAGSESSGRVPATVSVPATVRPTSRSDDAARTVAAVTEPRLIVLIEPRTLVRDCLAVCLSTHCPERVAAFPTVDCWMASEDYRRPSLVICTVDPKSRDSSVEDVMQLLSNSFGDVPVALLSDDEDFDEIVEALNHGVRGYIATSLTLKVAVEAIRLIGAGGVYVPASGMVAAKRSSADVSCDRYFNGIFTARQAAVVEALRRGKANKVIAYELNMRESTVKVHVRSIMKKLKAKNRTEVAFLANGFLNGDQLGSP